MAAVVRHFRRCRAWERLVLRYRQQSVRRQRNETFRRLWDGTVPAPREGLPNSSKPYTPHCFTIADGEQPLEFGPCADNVNIRPPIRAWGRLSWARCNDSGGMCAWCLSVVLIKACPASFCTVAPLSPARPPLVPRATKHSQQGLALDKEPE